MASRLKGKRSSRPVILAAALWMLVTVVVVAGPDPGAPHPTRLLHHLRGAVLAAAHAHDASPWPVVVDAALAAAVVASLLAVRAAAQPQAFAQPTTHEALNHARAIVDEYGEDSLSPFILRPDKAFQWGAGGVIAYRVVGETVVVSADPVGPDGSAYELLHQLLMRARQGGFRFVVYGASERHLDAYRTLGLRVLCAGEEAVVRPDGFTLEGRAVRKLRQSVHRVERRGWEVTIHEGRDMDHELEARVDELEQGWRASHKRVLGFAMSMGEFDLGVRPEDLFVLGWSPDGQLRALMRFIRHRGNLSLDAMRRVGATPNGLNEALVCHLLEHARVRGIREVSLNYAGLSHLFRGRPSGGLLSTAATRIAVACLRSHFQMDRLVLFNQKFLPAWRPRYLVYESRRALPGSVFRVLQAEGYLPQRRGHGRVRERHRWLHRSSLEGRPGR
jgi:lysyl-tRNA synthetase class 2